jgi:hypothetical protein
VRATYDARPGDTVAVHGGPVRVVELTERDGVPCALVTTDELTALVPTSWLVPVHVDRRS